MRASAVAIGCGNSIAVGIGAPSLQFAVALTLSGPIERRGQGVVCLLITPNFKHVAHDVAVMQAVRIVEASLADWGCSNGCNPSTRRRFWRPFRSRRGRQVRKPLSRKFAALPRSTSVVRRRANQKARLGKSARRSDEKFVFEKQQESRAISSRVARVLAQPSEWMPQRLTLLLRCVSL